MCPHTPPCPAPSAPDREAAHTIVSHPEQGWSLLCNGIVIFDDTGELLPGGAFIAPHRPTDLAAFDRRAGLSGLICHRRHLAGSPEMPSLTTLPKAILVLKPFSRLRPGARPPAAR
jgi:hypothetical protein